MGKRKEFDVKWSNISYITQKKNKRQMNGPNMRDGWRHLVHFALFGGGIKEATS